MVKKLLFLSGCALLTLLVLNRSGKHEERPAVQFEAVEPHTVGVEPVRRVNTETRIGTSNEVDNMLAVVNNYLVKTPLCGLGRVLSPTEVTVHATPTPSGTNLWLHTTNASHRFRYEHGVLWEAIALNSDLLGSNLERILQHAANSVAWTGVEASNAFVRLLEVHNIPDRVWNAPGRISIEPDVFNVLGTNGVLKPATLFFTVRVRSASGATAIEARFRPVRDDEPLTYWFNNLRAKERQSLF